MSTDYYLVCDCDREYTHAVNITILGGACPSGHAEELIWSFLGKHRIHPCTLRLVVEWEMDALTTGNTPYRKYNPDAEEE